VSYDRNKDFNRNVLIPRNNNNYNNNNNNYDNNNYNNNNNNNNNNNKTSFSEGNVSSKSGNGNKYKGDRPRYVPPPKAYDRVIIKEDEKQPVSNQSSGRVVKLVSGLSAKR